MLDALETYAPQTSHELRLGWLWGTTIKDHERLIVKRVFWSDGSTTLTFWELPKNARHTLYNHIDTLDFPKVSDYRVWLSTLENWNGVE